MVSKRFLLTGAFTFLIIGLVVLLNSFQGLTGFAVFEGADVRNGYYVGVWFILAGLLMLNISGTLEKKVEIYDRSHGKVRDHSKVYSIKDPELTLGNDKGDITLGEFEREINRIKDDKELIGMVRETYASPLRKIAAEEPEKAGIAKDFLRVLGVPLKDSGYELTNEEKMEIKNAFKAGYRRDFNVKQKEILRRYGLEVRHLSNNHLQVKTKDGKDIYVASETPSDFRNDMNVALSIIRMVEKERKRQHEEY